MFNCLWLHFGKGTQWVCGGVEEICVDFQQWNVAGSHARKENRVGAVASGMQSLGQDNLSYTSAVSKFAGRGSINVLGMRDLADAYEMGLGGSLVIETAALAAVYASSLPGILLSPGIHRRAVGPGRALRSDLR